MSLTQLWSSRGNHITAAQMRWCKKPNLPPNSNPPWSSLRKIKINKISCEFWSNPCLQVWLRLKMTHLLWHGGENEHLDWFSSTQKPHCACCCPAHWSGIVLTSGLLELLSIFLHLLPSPTAPQPKLGEARQRTSHPNGSLHPQREASTLPACLGAVLRCKPPPQMAETEFSVHWVCYFYPVWTRNMFV